MRVNGWTANAISLGLDDSEIFRNCLSIGGKGNDRVATLRLVEHSGIIRTILDALLLPVNKLAAIPSYWTFEDAAAELKNTCWTDTCRSFSAASKRPSRSARSKH